MQKINLTDRQSDDTQSIGELWNALSIITNNIVHDNLFGKSGYPLQTRIEQTKSVRSLVEAIERFHYHVK